MKFFDTNIILRYLLADDPHKAQKCTELFERTSRGKETLYTSTLVIIEVVWVLEKIYKLSRTEIASFVQKILNTPHLECDEKDLLLTTVGLYELKNIDFIDIYNAMVMGIKHISTIYSYDKDFDVFSNIARIEP